MGSAEIGSVVFVTVALSRVRTTTFVVGARKAATLKLPRVKTTIPIIRPDVRVMSVWPEWPSCRWRDVWGVDERRLKDRYDRWRSNPKSPEKIPRIIHQIWLGPKPVPFTEWSQRWRDLHPDWEYRLWRDDDLTFMHFGVADDWGARSDAARYEILKRYGGVYVDLDFRPIASLEGLLGVACFAGFSNVGVVEINNALIGAVKGHPVVVECARRRTTTPFNAIAGFLDADDPAFRAVKAQAAAGTIENSGPGLFTRVFVEYDDALCLPFHIFYPKPNRGDDDATTPATLAVHEWASSWQ